MKWVLLVLTAVLVVVHQDFWNWAQTEPLLGGFIPVGLWYHAAFCVACSVLLGLFVILAWPKELENAEPQTPEARQAQFQDNH